jgi:signal transduction histidine kinase
VSAGRVAISQRRDIPEGFLLSVDSIPEEPAPTIVVVDDDRANRAVVRAYLRERYRVLEAGDAETALELVEREKVDLVLLDVRMPGIDGYEACRAIKQSRAGKSLLPVVLLTALNERADRHRGLEAGADDFLTKPVDGHELRLRVAAFTSLARKDALLRRQKEQLEHLGALKDDLVSLLVHDMRNPLTSVMAVLSLLKKSATDPEAASDIALGMIAASRLRDVIEDVLEVHRLEAAELKLRIEEVSMRSLVRSAAETLDGAARLAGVRIDCANIDEVTIAVDRRLVRRALENLMTNAIKYSPRQAAVDVRARQAGDRIEIDVADRGPGIPEVARQRIFDKFGTVEARQDTARRGYGLGLYLVRLVAAAHHGEIRVRDREGGGTVFTLAVPTAA